MSAGWGTQTPGSLRVPAEISRLVLQAAAGAQDSMVRQHARRGHSPSGGIGSRVMISAAGVTCYTKGTHDGSRVPDH